MCVCARLFGRHCSTRPGAKIDANFGLLSEYGSDRVSAGIPSFNVQEEFSRYTGYWWQQAHPGASSYRILYELVDERKVPRVMVSGMTLEDRPSEFTFPRAGETNETVTHCIADIPASVFDTSGGSGGVDCKANGSEAPTARGVTTSCLGLQVHKRLPWMEYVVRCNWVPGRDEVSAC